MIIRTLQLAAVGTIAVAGMTVGDRIDESTHIKLGSALAVACVVVPAVWWLSSWMRGITDSISDLRDTVKDLQCVKYRNECRIEPKKKL